MAALATSYRKEMRIVRGRAQLGWLALLIAVLLYLPTVLETRAIFNFYFLTETQVLGDRPGAGQLRADRDHGRGRAQPARRLHRAAVDRATARSSPSARWAAASSACRPALPFIVVVLGSGLFGAAVGTLVGLPSLRLRGLYLLLSTLALHFIVLYLFLRYQLGQFGPAGISFETATLFGWTSTPTSAGTSCSWSSPRCSSWSRATCSDARGPRLHRHPRPRGGRRRRPA